MKVSLKNNYFPNLHYFEYDFLNMYEKTWHDIEGNWKKKKPEETGPCFLDHEKMTTLNIIDASCTPFYLLYSNNHFSPTSLLDFFYSKQESNGAIHAEYDKETGKPVRSRGNPHGLACPLLLWSEFNYFNKTDNKKRLKEIVPKLDAYLEWIKSVAADKTGLYHVPLQATLMPQSFRGDVHYPIDFNSIMASACFFMSKLANYTNHRNLVIKYTKKYYNLKLLINNLFWDDTDKIYYDLDVKQKFIKRKTVLSFCPMIAFIPTEEKVLSLMKYLNDPEHFQSQHPFPSLSMSDPEFSSNGAAQCGATHPLFNFLVIKGLENYHKYDLARESVIKHLYGMLSVIDSDQEEYSDTFWESYNPIAPLPAKSASKQSSQVRANYLMQTALSTITLMIENIIGIEINLPKKMLHWVVHTLEEMGIEHIQLKKNYISTMIVKSNRGWEIRHSSEKLYYFSVDVLEMNMRKTLPFPSGKCSLLLEKL